MRSLLVILAFVISSTAAAFPTQDTRCSACHSAASEPGGTISPETLSIDLGIGETGFVTFTVAGVPDNSRIALFNMNTAGVTVGSPDNWFFVDSGDMPYVSGNSASDYFIGLPGFDYDLTLTGDVLGTYAIDVLLVGGVQGAGGAWLDMASLEINVNPIPIPAAVWLFGSGLLGLVSVARMRRNKT